MLGESCGSSGRPLEGGLGRPPGKGPAEGVEGRLKGCGGVSYKRLGRRDVFYFAFKHVHYLEPNAIHRLDSGKPIEHVRVS